MYRIMIAALAAFFMSACTTTGMTVKSTPGNVEITELSKVSDKTIRYVTKLEIGKVLCDQQSFRHGDQRIIAKVGDTIIYSQIWAPFDMAGCLNAMSKTPWERLASQFINQVGAPLVKYGTGYAIASKTFDYLNRQNKTISDTASAAAENAAPRVEGDNNRVVVGDGSSYDENPGIPAGEITFSEIDLNEESVSEEPAEGVEAE